MNGERAHLTTSCGGAKGRALKKRRRRCWPAAAAATASRAMRRVVAGCDQLDYKCESQRSTIATPIRDRLPGKATGTTESARSPALWCLTVERRDSAREVIGPAAVGNYNVQTA